MCNTVKFSTVETSRIHRYVAYDFLQVKLNKHAIFSQQNALL
jgi:hypothetical protein